MLNHLSSRFLAVAIVVTALAAGIGGFFAYGRLSATLDRLESERFSIVVDGVKAGIEANLNLGLQLEGLSVAQGILDRERAFVAETRSVIVFAADGTVLFSSGEAPSFAKVPVPWLGGRGWRHEAAGWRAVGTVLTNSYGAVAGGVAALFSSRDREHTLELAAQRLAVAILATVLAAGIPVLFAVALAARRGRSPIPRAGSPDRTVRVLTRSVLAAILVAQLALAAYVSTLLADSLTPQLEGKTEAVTVSLAGRLEKALRLGIPFEALEGTEEYFADTLRRHRDLAFIALGSASGGLVHAVGISAPALRESLARARARPSTPPPAVPARWVDLPASGGSTASQLVSVGLRHGEDSAGTLHVGLQRGFLGETIAAARLDLWLVMAISLLVAFEWLRFSALASPARDGTQPAARVAPSPPPPLDVAAGVGRIRLAVFLFMFGEQLSRPFLPVFAQGLLPGGTAMAGFWAGLPVAAFMSVVALSIPVLTRWSVRRGRRGTFLWGVCAAMLGLLGACACHGIGDFIAWRLVTAAGYAAMYVACQGHIIDNSGEADRARGLAVFVGAVMLAELCAPALGGMVAEILGERAVFAVGAALMLPASLAGAAVLSGPPAASTAAAVAADPGSRRRHLLGNPRFALLLATAAVPAKFALTAFMFYIVPVGLAVQGVPKAEIGRLAMLYALPGLAAAFWFSRLIDRVAWKGLMVGLGGMISGAGFIPLLFWPGEKAYALAIAALGVGQALGIAPQMAMVSQICREEIGRHGAAAIFGAYRLVERTGAILGPLAAAALTTWLGPAEAGGALGILVFACAVAFSVSFLVLGLSPEQEMFAAGTGREAAP